MKVSGFLRACLSIVREICNKYSIPMEELAATSKLLPSSINLVIDATSKLPPKSEH